MPCRPEGVSRSNWRSSSGRTWSVIDTGSPTATANAFNRSSNQLSVSAIFVSNMHACIWTHPCDGGSRCATYILAHMFSIDEMTLAKSFRRRAGDMECSVTVWHLPKPSHLHFTYTNIWSTIFLAVAIHCTGMQHQPSHYPRPRVPDDAGSRGWCRPRRQQLAPSLPHSLHNKNIAADSTTRPAICDNYTNRGDLALDHRRGLCTIGLAALVATRIAQAVALPL